MTLLEQSLARIEADVLRELQHTTGDCTLGAGNITDWRNRDLLPREGEHLVFLPRLGLYVTYRKG